MEHRGISHRDTLLILVTSDRYFQYVENLALAALAKGKRVRIHIWGDGMAFIKTDAFKRLARLTRVSICDASLNEHSQAVAEALRETVKIVYSMNAATALKQCARHMVF